MAYKTKKRKSAKAKNMQKNTARSSKRWKLVLVAGKSYIKKMYSNSTKEINNMIKLGRKRGSLKWYLYSYRPSMKAYRLSKKSRNA